MFVVEPSSESRWVRIAIVGLIITNLLAALITIWTIIEVGKEQRFLTDVIQELRRESAELSSTSLELSRELRWQFGLTIVVLLNIVATGLALVILSRAYLLSQQSLRSLRELSANILASMDHGVITVDTNEVITGVNPKGQQMLGLTLSDFLMPISQWQERLEPLVQLNSEIRSRGESIRDLQFRFESEGKVVRFLSHGHVLKDSDGRPIGTVLHVTDITEQSELEERMRRMERYAGLGAVAAGLAHEIKNPLSALALHTQLLKEHMAPLSDAEVEESIDVLLHEVRRMTKVLDGFREFAAIDHLDPHPHSPVKLIEEVQRLFQPQLKSRHVTLELNINSCRNNLCYVDKGKIEQVLINLILNALEAMSDSGVLKISCESQENEICILIADSGPGIPESIQEQLFDPYFTTKDHGTGLGLAICEKIIRQHGGTIDYQTGEAGTTFKVTLPEYSA